MALTRSFLHGMKLDEEQVSSIIEAHLETVNGLKSVNAEIQTKLDEAKKALDEEKKAGWETKYADLNKEFEAYKATQQEKESTAAKEKAYIALLKNAGVSEKRIEGILKYDRERINSLELDEKGAVKGEKEIADAIASDWADFITKTGEKGASVPTPPKTEQSGAFSGMTLSEKMSYANEHPADPAVTAWLNNKN